MKNPKKEIILIGDQILVDNKLYIAKKDTRKYYPCVKCDMKKSICCKINCRNIYYKRLEGGI